MRISAIYCRSVGQKLFIKILSSVLDHISMILHIYYNISQNQDVKLKILRQKVLSAKR